MMRRPAALAAVAALVASAERADAAPLPGKVGACSETTIASFGPRLTGAPQSGSGISYANGGTQISYDVIGALRNARSGDPVRLCLVSVPTGCPRGDTRGRIYAATNLRTGASWTAPDSGHMCGGA